MDEIFEHLLQDTDRGISINQIVNRIVFPNHDICMPWSETLASAALPP